MTTTLVFGAPILKRTKFAGLTFNASFVKLIPVIVLEKLVKPPVRRAPTGAFRHFSDKR